MMDSKFSAKVVSLFLISSICLLGYVSMSAFGGISSIGNYDVKIDSIPVNFDDGKTIVLNVESNDRAYIVTNDQLTVRSPFITYYSTNLTGFTPERYNVVNGSYCYLPIPAMNATVGIIEQNRVSFSASNGSVTVYCLKASSKIVRLQVNSTTNPILNITAYGLVPNSPYRVTIDGERIGIGYRSNYLGILTVSYSGDWSTHTIVFKFVGIDERLVENIFLFGLVFGFGAIMFTIILSRRRRG